MKPMLFSTPHCGMCNVVKQMLTKRSIEYEYIDCTLHIDITLEYGIQHVPTLIVGEEVYNTLPSIKEWIEQQKTN